MPFDLAVLPLTVAGSLCLLRLAAAELSSVRRGYLGRLSPRAAFARLAEIDGLGHRRQSGPTMFSGRTIASNSSAET